jgi:cAMP phosphodiesterase
MIAVDAGSHLANIVRILERQMPLASEKLPPKGYSRILEEGPFAGISFPNISAKANGLHIFRELLHAFLITHPHLDHLSGMAINTPALEYGRGAKAIVALPSTIEAIKNHIFNDYLWPNLSDESNGVGFVTYRRLIEGGNPRLGSGESRGYVSVCDGLATKCWSVTHGRCQRRNPSLSHQHSDSFGWNPSEYNFPSRRMSRMSDDHGYFAAVAQQQQQQSQNIGSASYPAGALPMSMPAGPPTPGGPGGAASAAGLMESNHMFEPVSSSAFFIRNDTTGHEILIFGDVEPDSVSMTPRNHVVWDDAAWKIVDGTLKAIFIECSYDDSVRNEDLYGHLCPRHLVAELTFLAHCVVSRQKQKQSFSATLSGATDISERDMAIAANDSTTHTAAADMSMRQPPTSSELKRKRKRAVNGDLARTPEVAPSTSFESTMPSPRALLSAAASPSYVGTRSASSASRRKMSRESNIGGPPTPARGRSVTFQPWAEPSSANSPASGAAAAVAAQQFVSGGQIVTAGPGSGSSHSLSSTTTTATATQAQTNQPFHSRSWSGPPRERLSEPLKGLVVHIIHVKDTLADGPSPGDVILGQLRAQGEEVGLGADFSVTNCGDSIWI